MFKFCLAFLAALMLACLVRAEDTDFAARVAAFKAAAKPAPSADPFRPAAKSAVKTTCDCGGDPALCTCDACQCPGCTAGLFWAADPDAPGYLLCSPTRVVGCLYPSGVYRARDAGGAWKDKGTAPPILRPAITWTCGPNGCTGSYTVPVEQAQPTVTGVRFFARLGGCGAGG